MAREITLPELQRWLKLNKRRLWAWEDPVFWDIPEKKKTLEIKYLSFRLDTRDMKIFRIDTDGAGPDYCVDIRDDGKDWSLLDLLESKLKK